MYVHFKPNPTEWDTDSTSKMDMDGAFKQPTNSMDSSYQCTRFAL